MRLTGWSRFALIALAALAMVAGVTLPAAAQFGPTQPGGVIASTSGSGSVNASTQVATAQTFLTHTVATSLVTRQPIRIKSVGYLATALSSPGTFSVTVAVGGVSLTPVSAVTLTAGMLNTPYTLACDLVPTTASTASTWGLAVELVCNFSYRSAGADGAASTVLQYIRRTTGTLSATPTQAITATVTFSDTGISTGLVAQHNRIVAGN